MKRLFWLALSIISFTLVGFMYFSSNPEQIYVTKADYYYKKNDISSAIKFYEHAFENGSKNPNARYNYVDLVTSSPINADMQEKLIKLIKEAVDDGAEYRASSFLSDLRYEIHREYPDNYISQATYNQKIIRWSDNPITYGYTNAEIAPEYFIREIDSAFGNWERHLRESFKFKKVDKNPDIIIRFNNKKTDAEQSEKYIVALTKPTINQNKLVNMTTEYYLTSPDGKYFTENQVYNTALHEIGHAIGFMGHSDYKKNIMYMSTDTKTVTNDLRKILTQADINTMKLLYKIKPDITNVYPAKGEYTKYLILGSENEVITAKIREAKTYIQKAPNLSAGYVDLADSYVAAGEYSKAKTTLKKALQLAKDEATACMICYNIALTDYYSGNYDSAKVYLEKSGELKNTEDAIRLSAEIYLKSGAKSEAINLYEYLISKNPSNIEYIISLTNIYVRDKEYFKARQVLKSYLTKYPEEKQNPRLAPYGIIKIFL